MRRSHLADQLRRASISIPLNIAEGSGEFSRKERARFYRMARRSATECRSIVGICQRLALVEECLLAKARPLLARVVSMLTKMVRPYGR